MDTSVSALVREYLRSLARGRTGDGTFNESVMEPESQVRRRLLQEVFEDFDARGVGLRMSDNLSREELYDRDRARAEAEKERRRRLSE